MKFIGTAQLALVIVVGMATVVNAQDPFSGDWRGKIVMVKDNSEAPFRVFVGENKADNYYCENGKWNSYQVALHRFDVQRNNALLTWIDKGGVWTETQVFSLSYVNKETLALVWVRHVNNIEEGDFATWHTFGHGTLRKSTDSQSNCDSIP